MRSPLLLALLCLSPTLVWAQPDLRGDYRLDGEDSREDPYTAEVSIQRVGSSYRLTRTATYWADEDRVQRPRTWVASHAELEAPGVLRVTFGGETTGITGLLAPAVDDSDDLDEPVEGTYRWTAEGTLEEHLRSDDPVGGKKGWTEALATGGRDHPSLVLEREAKLETLLGDELRRYEASGVTRVGDQLIVVFDNAKDMARIGVDLVPGLAQLVETDGGGASDFEGVTFDPVEERFYVIVEADRKDGDLAARLWELREDLSVKDKEWLPFEPPSRGKGFEGLLHVRRGEREYLLALLEGNHGESDERSIDRGHGEVVVFERKSKGKRWKYEATFELPESAAFTDYSGLDLRGNRLVVVSQTSSLLWVGSLSPTSWRVDGPGQVYRFPRDRGVAVYASVEGVAWLSDDRLAVVSDRYHGKVEPCEAKDQSVHLFRLPH